MDQPWLASDVDDAECACMCVCWMAMLTSPRCASAAAVAVGMAGLHGALLLCAAPRTAYLFIAHGGAAALAALARMRHAMPAIVRQTAAACAALTASAGAAGCAALLGHSFHEHGEEELLEPACASASPAGNAGACSPAAERERGGGGSGAGMAAADVAIAEAAEEPLQFNGDAVDGGNSATAAGADNADPDALDGASALEEVERASSPAAAGRSEACEETAGIDAAAPSDNEEAPDNEEEALLYGDIDMEEGARASDEVEDLYAGVAAAEVADMAAPAEPVAADGERPAAAELAAADDDRTRSGAAATTTGRGSERRAPGAGRLAWPDRFRALRTAAPAAARWAATLSRLDDAQELLGRFEGASTYGVLVAALLAAPGSGGASSGAASAAANQALRRLNAFAAAAEFRERALRFAQAARSAAAAAAGGRPLSDTGTPDVEPASLESLCQPLSEAARCLVELAGQVLEPVPTARSAAAALGDGSQPEPLAAPRADGCVLQLLRCHQVLHAAAALLHAAAAREAAALAAAGGEELAAWQVRPQEVARFVYFSTEWCYL